MVALTPREADIQMLLAASAHLGTKNLHPACERYVYARRNDGVYIIDVAKTWDKMQLAARVIVAVENAADVVLLSARPYGQRAILKFAHYTGAKALAGRHTPGEWWEWEEVEGARGANARSETARDRRRLVGRRAGSDCRARPCSLCGSASPHQGQFCAGLCVCRSHESRERLVLA